MTRFAIFDSNNLVQRCKHAVKGVDSTAEFTSRVYSIVFNSIRKSYEKFNANHAVFCFDGWSWRREFYPDYKGRRRDAKSERPPEEVEKDETVKKIIDSLQEFLSTSTNVTVLHSYGFEADDFISRWVQLHQDDRFDHVIISGDSDFKQLVRSNVELYNPLQFVMYTCSGVFFQDGRRAGKSTLTAQRYGEEWKIKLDKNGEPEQFDPEWELFQKCIRGDASDSVPSAFPRVSTTRLKKAFADRGGMEWNNLINETWGPDDARQSVRERYEMNRTLIDLTQQPPELIEIMDQVIAEAKAVKKKQLIAVHFAKFCQQNNLSGLLTGSNGIVSLLSRAYIDQPE